MKCPLCCSKEFKCKEELTKHLKLVKSNLKCPICKKLSDDFDSLIIHLENGCSNDSEVSSTVQSDTTSVTQTLENIITNENHLNEDVSMDSVGNFKENKVLPLRKRRKSNLSQWSKRKTLGKNNSNEFSQFTSELENTTGLPNGTEINKELSLGISSQTTQNSTAESEIDVDNISMLSDESSFTTTNDYSSSQNEILSDEDCTENAVGFSVRPPYQSNSNRCAPLFRNNERQGNSGFINNLQVITNNFHTTSLNNENSSPSANIPLERKGNYQRRNTKNSQLNNNCQASTSSGSFEQGTTQHNVTMHNNLQAHRTSKSSNSIPMTYANNASSSLSLPAPSIFTVANNSPHKYAVKNTNISNNTPVGSKDIPTANLEHQSSTKLSSAGSNTISSDGNLVSPSCVSRDIGVNSRQDDNGRLTDSTGSVLENTVDIISQNQNSSSSEPSDDNRSLQTSHPVVSRSKSSRMQKIQNVDCIQNSSSTAYNINPSASALCKTNSFSLCNYSQNNQATSKCKLVKFNTNQQIQSTAQSAGEVTMVTNSTTNARAIARHQVRSPTMIHSTRDCSNVINNERQEFIQSSSSEDQVRNQISSVITSESACNSVEISQSPETSECNTREVKETNCTLNSSSCEITSFSFEHNTNNTAITEVQPTSDIEVDSNDKFQDNTIQCTSHNIPSTLNNLNNTATSNTVAPTHNICSLTNNLHKNKKSNLNQLGRRNVGKEEKVFTIGKDMRNQSNMPSTSDGYQMINNSIERNFNKLNSCSQEINAHKNVKTTKDKNKRHKKSVRRPQVEQLEEVRSHNEDSNSTRITNTGASSSNPLTNNSSINRSGSASDHNPSTSANIFPDMKNTVSGNQNKTLFNNKNHITSKMDKTHKNISNVFNKKELVNITRNNFNLAQDHSNVRRSNSLNVKINDLADGNSATQSDSTKSVRKNVAKSNSFSIQNDFSEPVALQSSTEVRQLSRNLKNNVSIVESNPTVSASNELASNIGDNLEEFRLEEASNDVCDIPSLSEENNLNVDSDNQTNPLEAFSGLVLNNCIENTENHPTNTQNKAGSSTSGAVVTNPQMIHNNFEPRCKKNKKCNEERGPLKPINSENKPKPNDQ